MYFSHLECSVPCGAGPFDARAAPSSLPVLRHAAARALRPGAARAWSRDILAGRAPEHVAVPRADAALPRRDARHARRRLHARCCATAASAHAVGLDRLFVKDESLNPTNSFKARGPVGRHHPRQGPRRRRRSPCPRPAMPATRPPPTPPPPASLRGVHAAGRQAALHRRVPALRRQRHARRRPDHRRRQDGRREAASCGWYDVSTLKEPYRVEGKKTMGYELAEQLGWTLPDWIVYPTGGGTGMVGMWKAFDEMEATRLDRLRAAEDGDRAGRRLRADRPRLRRTAPNGGALWENRDTVADGLRVPKAIGDFLVLRAIRESGGTARRGHRPADGRRHAAHRPARGHLGRARGRGRSARHRACCSPPARMRARRDASCSSTPAAR